jgi:hypothetical protein
MFVFVCKRIDVVLLDRSACFVFNVWDVADNGDFQVIRWCCFCEFVIIFF